MSVSTATPRGQKSKGNLPKLELDLPEKLFRDSPTEKLPECIDLEKAIMALLYHEPFYGHVIQKMRRVLDDKIITMGVGARKTQIYFIINPFFWNHYAKDPSTFVHCAALLKHEVWHLIHEHLFRIDDRHPIAWNIACDLSINCRIPSLPPGCLMPEQFGFPDDMMAEWYYNSFPKDKDGHPCPFDHTSGPGEPCPICSGPGQPGDGDPGPGGQEEGEGDGGEGEEDSKGGDGKCIHKKLAEMGAPGNHDQWGDDDLSDSNSDYIRDKIKQIVQEAVQEAKKQAGKMPAGLEEAINEALKPPQHWKQKLKRFCYFASMVERVPSRHRPNRRTGYLNPGKTIETKLRLAVAFDTSGSVDDTQLAQFVAEITKIAEYATVICIECDAAVQRVFEFDPVKLKTVTGRGGTAFGPAFKVANEEIKPDALIYLTDGYNWDDDLEKPRYPVMWVMTSNHQKQPWGRHVILEV